MASQIIREIPPGEPDFKNPDLYPVDQDDIADDNVSECTLKDYAKKSSVVSKQIYPQNFRAVSHHEQHMERAPTSRKGKKLNLMIFDVNPVEHFFCRVVKNDVLGGILVSVYTFIL